MVRCSTQGRNEGAQNFSKEDCKENTWNHIRRNAGDQEQGDKEHITRQRHCKIYKIPLHTVMLEECKTNKCQNKLQQLQRNGRNNEKRKTKYKMERQDWRRLKDNGNKKHRQTRTTDIWKWGRTALETKVHSRLQCLRRWRQEDLRPLHTHFMFVQGRIAEKNVLLVELCSAAHSCNWHSLVATRLTSTCPGSVIPLSKTYCVWGKLTACHSGLFETENTSGLPLLPVCITANAPSTSK